jgi:hypothetical protein
MTALLITALRAAETLAAYHRERIEQTLGPMRAYHERVHRLCLEDINDIKWQLAVSGATAENQARAVRSQDLEAAQRIVAAHFLPEWRGSEKAPQAMEAMAQAMADAMQAARGGTAFYLNQ